MVHVSFVIAIAENGVIGRDNAMPWRLAGDMVLQIQLERGYAGFKVIDFSEGIESGTPIAQRYSEGIFKLVKVDPALPR